MKASLGNLVLPELAVGPKASYLCPPVGPGFLTCEVRMLIQVCARQLGSQMPRRESFWRHAWVPCRHEWWAEVGAGNPGSLCEASPLAISVACFYFSYLQLSEKFMVWGFVFFGSFFPYLVMAWSNDFWKDRVKTPSAVCEHCKHPQKISFFHLEETTT